MPVFDYEGLSKAGKTIKGIRDADSPRALRAALSRDGIILTKITPAEQAQEQRRRNVDLRRMLRRVSPLDVSIATRQLATLLQERHHLAPDSCFLLEQGV